MRDEVETIARVRGRVSPEAIATVELARRLDGVFLPYEVADSDPQYDLRYRCSGSAASRYPRLWRRVGVPLLTESGRQRWVSLDRDFADDAEAVRAEGGDEVAVEMRIEQVRFTSRTGPRAGQLIEFARPRLSLPS